MISRRAMLLGKLTRTVARIDAHRCLAWTGGFCSTCEERCPEAAITLVGRGPQVTQVDCTGCGTCIRRCPAPDGGAIRTEQVWR